MDIEELLSKINPSLQFIPSYRDLSADSHNNASYFFCHIPKCGGIDFELPIRNSLLVRKLEPWGIADIGCLSGRVDSDALVSQLNQRLATLSGKVVNFHSSHQGLKHYEQLRLPANTHLLTFVRDPLERSLSHFCYLAMRQKANVSMSLFRDYYRRKEQQNAIFKSLTSNRTLEQLIEFIGSRFYVCADVSYIDSVASFILSRHHRPNIVKDRLNVTLPEYRLKLSDIPSEYQREFHQLNSKDYELYEYVKANPILPDMKVGERLSEASLVVYARQAQSRFEVGRKCVHTQTFFNRLDQQPPFNCCLREFAEKTDRAT